MLPSFLSPTENTVQFTLVSVCALEWHGIQLYPASSSSSSPFRTFKSQWGLGGEDMVAMYFLKLEIIFNLIMKFLQSGLREKDTEGQ